MKRSFIHGAFVLMVAATINRIVGFIYQAVIYRLIGPEGVGLFNLVYPVYILIIVIATAGIPLGISKLVSEEEVRGNHRKSYQILWLSVTILIISGAFFTVVSYLISPVLMKYVFVNKMVYRVFLALIPGIFVISVSSAFRGFFQGLMNMKIPAAGQVIEQTVRVFVGFYLATLLLPRGIDWAAVGLAVASISGEAVGLLFMLFVFKRHKPLNFRFSLPGITVSSDILRRLFEMCAPITLGRVAATVMLSVDSVLIPWMLKNGGQSTSEVTALYGQFTTVALTLLFIPSVITVSLATSLVPAISEAVAQNRPMVVKTRTREALRVTLIAGIPFIAAFLTLPDQITEAIYGTPSGSLLRALAAGGLLVYIQQTSTGILQGLGLPSIPLKNMIIGGLVKIIAICLFAQVPGAGIIGIAYAYDIYFLIAAGLNVVSLYKNPGFRLNLINDMIKPVAAGIAAGMVFLESYSWLYSLTDSTGVSVTVSLLTGFTVYLTGVVWLGSVTRSDYMRLNFIRELLGKPRF